MKTKVLGYVDYIVFGLSLVISLVIGVYHSRSGGKQRSVQEYLMGNRRFTCLPVALSLLVTFQSGISLLGLPVEIYYYGTQIYMGIVGLVVGYTIVAIFIVPVLHPLQITSVYEYLEMRFQSRAVRLVGCLLGLLFTMTYMAVCLFLPGLAMESVTGFPKWASISVVAVVVIIYTMLGGIKAVVWTDVFQFVVMLAGISVLLIKVYYQRSVEELWETAKIEDRLQFFNFDADPTNRQTFWAVTIGTITSWIGNALSQSGIQRICATESIGEARKSVFFNIPAAVLYETLMTFLGVTMFAYFSLAKCGLQGAGLVHSSNEIVPYFMMEQLSDIPGLAGLFLASLFSATLSTMSSGLSAISALVWEDIIQPYFQCFTLRQGSIVTKATVSVFGGIIVGMSFLAMNLPGTITQITLGTLSATSGPLVGVYLLGMIFPWATAKSAVVSGVLAFSLCLSMTIGSNLYPTKYPQLDPIPTYGCRGFNSTLKPLYNVSIHSVNTTISEQYNGRLIDNIQPFHAVNYTLVPPTGQSEDNNAPWLFRVSFLWYHVTGVVTTLISGTILSIVSGGFSDIPCEERFVFLFVRRLNCYRKRLKIKQPLAHYTEFRASFRSKYDDENRASFRSIEKHSETRLQSR
ncbi:sodium-coupled monocarboxylate transporter 1-like isoform X2 [Saccostrea echinata]|uniref:sodium-coupled monocarboxylate transporter 1-like isoform X2 n=1 Tax=Saccostrea echinata TaxID=191078 RepID=UPI002A8160B3|nr:sodium-coupled monocarboxylate transporter 1-like isoform X2 [Saccostrea echinata]